MTDLDSKLILKYQRCETTPQEEEQVLDYLEQSEAHRREMDRANFLFCAALLNGKSRKARTLHPRWYWGMAAALATLLIGTLLFLSKKTKSSTPETLSCVTIEVPEGSKTRITLPDGSGVWLNSGSKLTYSESFDRTVTLDGEGYFDIVHQEGEIFSIHTSQLSLEVLGTVFNIRAFATENRVETTLATGKLRLRDTQGQKLALLHPGEQVRCEADGAHLDIQAVDAWKLLLDTYGVVTIPEASLTELCGIINRVYGVSVKACEDDGTPVTFSFSKESSVEEVVSRLSSLCGKKFDIKKDGRL